MKKRLILAILILSAVPMIALAQEGTMNDNLLLDDFSGELSAVGTRWEGFTDQVMGGVSEMSARIQSDGADNFLHLSGTVSLENNGGFIQVRLRLDTDKLTTLAIVAAKKAFSADLYVDVVYLYR